MKITLTSCQNKYCGLGQYTDNLARALDTIGNEVSVYRKDNQEKPLFHAYPYRSLKKLRPYIAPYFLSRAIKPLQADVWQADYVDAAMGCKMAGKNQKLFVTIHDAIPFRFRGDKIAFKVYQYQLKKAAAVAQKLIVVSHHAKEEVLKFTDIPADKIAVVYNGIDHSRFKPGKEDTNREVFTIKYLGGLGAPHKNAKALLETALLLKQKGLKFKMIIGGMISAEHPLVLFKKQHKLDEVEFKGFVSEEELPGFYSDADLFFYPSLIEGFGFPPLEAMASGTPALVSDIPVLRETLSDAAYFSEPNTTAYAAQIENIMNDGTHRNAMQQKGITQAQQYTWAQAAKEMMALYQSA